MNEIETMVTAPKTLSPAAKSKFPFESIQSRLRNELEEAEAESKILHPWEPMLDSLRMVTVISTLEDLFPFPIPPEKVVKRGGYKSVDEAFDHMFERLQRQWTKHQKKGN